LSIYQSRHVGTIPAPNESTTVNYFIEAFDQSGFSTTSPTYTFLVGSGPTVTIENPPAAISGAQDLVLNVTISDVDGVGDINKSSAIAYYRLEGSPNWSSVSLSYLHDLFDGLSAEFSGAIPSSNLTNQETILHVMANCSDSLGLEGSSGDQPIIIDSLAPRVLGITISGGVLAAGLENVTLISSEVNITATFNDSAGISSVSIYYSIPNDTVPIKSLMANSSDIGPTIDQSSFEITLPAVNETAFVGYFFETQDHFGNIGNSSVNTYYADGTGPLLAAIEIFPLVITNNTDAAILFNASDYSMVSESVVWYSYDNGTTWNSDTAALIDYGKEIIYQEPFEAVDVPFLIADQETSYLTLEVVRGAKVDQAVLTVGFIHDQSTDLRIWLSLQDGRRFLVFDREVGPIDNTISVDLFSLGLNQSDFSQSNFTLEIQDFSDQYSGFITAFQIELVHYRYPLGFEYIANIPRSENDTTVTFYLTLTDVPLNAENTSTFSYYADGLPPEISIPAEQLANETLDLDGAAYLQIMANATDQGGISSVEVYYRFSENASWQIASMLFDAELTLHSYSVPLPEPAGNMTYMIRAYDRAGLTTQSSEYTIQFTNGQIAPSFTPESSEADSGGNGNLGQLLFLGILAMLGLGAIGGALIYFYYSRIKSKTP
jgi:subtilisin-like proprotein convertase family protein